MIPFVEQVADELTQKLRQARCLDRRDERVDARAMGYNWRMKATSAAFSRGVSCTPRMRLKKSTVSPSVKR